MTLNVDAVADGLVIVDVQGDFLPGGALPVAGGDEIVAPLAALLGGPVRFGAVVATQDWHPAGHVSFASAHAGRAPFETIELYGREQVLWPDHCVAGTAGAALGAGLPVEPLSAILRKGQDARVDSYSAFRDNHGPGGERRETGLAGYLRSRGVRRVVVCGLALDVCVAWTLADAVELGFAAVLLRDLARPVTAAGGAAALAALDRAGVTIATSPELRRAG